MGGFYHNMFLRTKIVQMKRNIHKFRINHFGLTRISSQPNCSRQIMGRGCPLEETKCWVKKTKMKCQLANLFQLTWRWNWEWQCPSTMKEIWGRKQEKTRYREEFPASETKHPHSSHILTRARKCFQTYLFVMYAFWYQILWLCEWPQLNICYIIHHMKTLRKL